MALEPAPFAVRTLGPFPKQVGMLSWRMNIPPLVGRMRPNDLVEPSLRVQIISSTLGRFQSVRFTPSCW